MVRLQVFFALVVLWASPIFSQLPQVAESRLGVDSVKIEGGKRLYGFLLSRRADQSIVFSVGRQWLETTHPSLLAEFTGLERDRFDLLRQQRIERLEAWIEERPNDRRLVSFLEDELTRFRDMKLTDVGKRKFVTLELPSTRYRPNPHRLIVIPASLQENDACAKLTCVANFAGERWPVNTRH